MLAKISLKAGVAKRSNVLASGASGLVPSGVRILSPAFVMGIKAEFNPELALRNFAVFKAGRREEDECIPERLDPGTLLGILKQCEMPKEWLWEN